MGQYNVTALGEVLIDFTPSHISENGNPTFERNPGGAPANVLAGLSNYGMRTAFIGKVGNDMFGKYLKDVLEQYRISTEGLLTAKDENTTLAFVQLAENGERSFSFYRNPGADLMLYKSEINRKLIDEADIFHFGSVSMTGNPAREATLGAAQYAKEKGKLISYDPNLRLLLWESEEKARRFIMEGMVFCDILKISEEELEFLVGESDYSKGSELLIRSFNIPVVLVTAGDKGCFYKTPEFEGFVKSFKVSAIDTTGAGDAFVAGFLYKFINMKMRLSDIKEEDLISSVVFGNASGALATTKKGAIPAMPGLEEVNKLIEENL